jgi:hypothetical protein
MHRARLCALALFLGGLSAAGCCYRIENYGYTREFRMGKIGCAAPLNSSVTCPCMSESANAVQLLKPVLTPPLSADAAQIVKPPAAPAPRASPPAPPATGALPKEKDTEPPVRLRIISCGTTP